MLPDPGAARGLPLLTRQPGPCLLQEHLGFGGSKLAQCRILACLQHLGWRRRRCGTLGRLGRLNECLSGALGLGSLQRRDPFGIPPPVNDDGRGDQDGEHRQARGNPNDLEPVHQLRGASTQTRKGCFMRPACCSAVSPHPQK